jgi:cytochrome c553
LKRLRHGVGAALLIAALPLHAQDAELGRAKAQACAVCHGVNGIANTPDAPHLAGQPVIYLTAQLRAYRNGKRAHEVMGVLARGLSDEDIGHLAAWYASIRVEVQLPR